MNLFQKLRQIYKGEDFPPTIEKTKLKGSPKKQPQFTGSCSSSPAAIRKAASAAPRATTAATAEAVAAAFAGTAATPSKRQQTPPVPKKNNGNNKRMPLSSQENTQQQEEEGETDSPVTKPAAASGAPGAGYCKGAMADKMSDLAARFGKQNSSPEIVNKATSKVKHVRR